VGARHVSIRRRRHQPARDLSHAPRPDELPATGFSPAELVLAGAGACSAWDIVHILAKGREQLVDVEVMVEGRQDAAEPHPFREVTLRYVVTGHGLRAATVERAVRLSHERYCSAIATIRGVASIDYAIEIRDAWSPAGPADLPADQPTPSARSGG
jgi:putative redox protein